MLKICRITQTYLVHTSLLFVLQAATFTQVVDSDDGADDKAMTAMGILNTIETLLMVVEDHKEVS